MYIPCNSLWLKNVFFIHDVDTDDNNEVSTEYSLVNIEPCELRLYCYKILNRLFYFTFNVIASYTLTLLFLFCFFV